MTSAGGTNILTRMLNDFPTLLPSPAFFTPPSTSPSSLTLCSPLHHYHGYLPVLSTQYRIDIRLRFPPSSSPPSPHPPAPPSTSPSTLSSTPS